MKFSKIATKIAVEMIRKSGVREWDSSAVRLRIINAALEFAYAFSYFPGSPIMAITATFRRQTGTVKTWKSSGGDGALTLASLANGSYRQGAKVDLAGAAGTFARQWAVFLDTEHAATPTAGATCDVWMAPSSSATAGTDNGGNVSGTDAAYSGYSSDAANSVPQLQFVGSLFMAARATTTVQKGFVGIFEPVQRYVSPVILNNAGSAFHSSDSNCQLRLVPIEDTAEA